jgi:hypothetical protein
MQGRSARPLLRRPKWIVQPFERKMLKLQRVAAWTVVAGTVVFLTAATLIGAWPL